ncbi:MAG TPA: DUF2848 family protein [Chloroflexota bacterium]|jgi:hypothetical protein
MRPTLDLEVVRRDGSRAPLKFPVQSVWNGGLAFRNLSVSADHIAELRQQGIEAEVERPMVFPLSPHVVTTADEIDVLGAETSGEIEYVLFVNGDEIHVGVGSDHSDRVLERVTVQMSKQVCPDVAARQVWPYADVRDHWDRLVLRSTVTVGGDRVVYQETPLEVLCTVDYMLDLLRQAGAPREGLVLFSGTIPTLEKRLLFPEGHDIELEDPVLGRRLHHHYGVRVWARRAGEPYQTA